MISQPHALLSRVLTEQGACDLGWTTFRPVWWRNYTACHPSDSYPYRTPHTNFVTEPGGGI